MAKTLPISSNKYIVIRCLVSRLVSRLVSPTCWKRHLPNHVNPALFEAPVEEKKNSVFLGQITGTCWFVSRAVLFQFHRHFFLQKKNGVLDRKVNPNPRSSDALRQKSLTDRSFSLRTKPPFKVDVPSYTPLSLVDFPMCSHIFR